MHAFVTTLHGSTAPLPHSVDCRALFPKPSPPSSSLRRMLHRVEHCLFLLYKPAICTVLAAALVFGVYIVVETLPDRIFDVQWAVIWVAVLCVAGTKRLSRHSKHWSIDVHRGEFRDGRAVFNLSEVCCFYVAERFSSRTLMSSDDVVTTKSYGLELVSLHRPTFLTFMREPRSLREPSPIHDAALHLEDFLWAWQLQHYERIPLPCQAIMRFCLSSGSVQITRRSELLRDRPRGSSLWLNERDDKSFWCYRRIRQCCCLRFMLRFFSFGTPMWLICAFITLLRPSPALPNGIRLAVQILCGLWVMPLVLLIVLHMRREAWHMTREGVVTHCIGWPVFSIRRRYDISQATAVMLHVARAKERGRLGTNGTNRTGGWRFALGWSDTNGEELLRIEKLLGGEAGFLAEKVREVYPDMFDETANDVEANPDASDV